MTGFFKKDFCALVVLILSVLALASKSFAGGGDISKVDGAVSADCTSNITVRIFTAVQCPDHKFIVNQFSPKKLGDSALKAGDSVFSVKIEIVDVDLGSLLSSNANTGVPNLKNLYEQRGMLNWGFPTATLLKDGVPLQRFNPYELFEKNNERYREYSSNTTVFAEGLAKQFMDVAKYQDGFVPLFDAEKYNLDSYFWTERAEAVLNKCENTFASVTPSR